MAEWTADGVCLLLLRLHQFDEDFVCEEEPARCETEMCGCAFKEFQVKPFFENIPKCHFDVFAESVLGKRQERYLPVSEVRA